MLHMLGSKRKKKTVKAPQNKLFLNKANLPSFSCSFTLVCVHSFSPMVVNFLSLLKAGVQQASGTLFRT